MPWNGSGSFTRGNGVNSGDTTWQDDASSVETILADRHDTHDEDLADGINACLTKNGENAATLIKVDNLKLDGNTLSSTDTNGNINLTPDGTGVVEIAEGNLSIGSTVVTPTAAELNTAKVYTTAVLSPSGDDTKDFGRLCRITLNAQNDQATVKIKVSYHSDRNYAEFLVGAKQVAALNSDPECTITCTLIDNLDTGGDALSRLLVTSLVAFYTISATESYIDIYFNDSFADDLVWGYQFDLVDLVATSEFTPVSAETPIAALSWDVTSQAAPGVIVYDADLTLGGDFSTQTARLIATRQSGGYKCELFSTDNLTHASLVSASSAVVIPADYIPTEDAPNIFYSDYECNIETNGTIELNYTSARTSSVTCVSCSWFVTD